jgi:hypothetical protein
MPLRTSSSSLIAVCREPHPNGNELANVGSMHGLHSVALLGTPWHSALLDTPWTLRGTPWTLRGTPWTLRGTPRHSVALTWP